MVWATKQGECTGEVLLKVDHGGKLVDSNNEVEQRQYIYWADIASKLLIVSFVIESSSMCLEQLLKWWFVSKRTLLRFVCLPDGPSKVSKDDVHCVAKVLR